MERPEKEKQPPLSVSAAMNLAKGALENVTVRMVGEVSEVSNKPGYKAVYFTVKDETASLPCMIWTNRYKSCGVALTVGNLVEISGRFTLYAAKGRMNFDVFSISLAGEGELRMRVAAIARRLDGEGLTSPARKRPIPQLPATIGVVTSPRGAAVHDVLRTLRRRYPLARVLLAGVPVEGANAPAGLKEGLHVVTEAGAEVILLVRGGGSFEDLMPFNDEGLARCIASSPVPVVTGIGHEPDTTIADMVTDLRASTPTAAAEAVSPGMNVVNDRVRSLGLRMHDVLHRRLERSAIVLDRYVTRPVMADPHVLLSGWIQDVDGYAERLARALPNSLERNQASLESAYQRLVSCGMRFGRDEALRIDSVRARLYAGLTRVVEGPRTKALANIERMVALGAGLTPRFQSELAMSASRLNDLSPLAVLSRGYAIARDSDGEVVRDVDQVNIGTDITVAVQNGELLCNVLERVRTKECE